jgi:hypothetical protein
VGRSSDVLNHNTNRNDIPEREFRIALGISSLATATHK